jgi:hypothetical protein
MSIRPVRTPGRRAVPSRMARLGRRLLMLVATAILTAVITVGVEIGACVSVGGDVPVCAGAAPNPSDGPAVNFSG